MLTEIANLFEGQLSPKWADEITDWGERVAMSRKYLEGDHEVYLTNNMRGMLNITGKKNYMFSADYTDMVVRMFSERLVVEQIEAVTPRAGLTRQTATDGTADDDPSQAWVDRLLKKNRFDALQSDVHEVTPGDGDCFIIVDFDEEQQCARMNFNEAYDGDVGMIAIYPRRSATKMMAAVKVFYIGEEQKQINVYYPDRVERYQTDDTGQGLSAISAIDGDPVEWHPGVLPVVHFSNRRRRNKGHGISELQKMITLQDILNRTLVSMVMTTEFSAFPIIFAKGFTPNAITMPGDVMYYNEEDPNKLQYADVKKIPESELTGYIDVINKLIDLIAEVTQTPIASVMGTNPSGEALKQRESGLLTKIQGAQVKFGNAWEDVLTICHKVEMTYVKNNAMKPPAIDMFDCKWRDASMRSEMDVITQAGMVYDKLSIDELYVEMVAAVTGWDAPKQAEILEMKQIQSASNVAGMNLGDGFGNLFDFATQLNGVPAA